MPRVSRLVPDCGALHVICRGNNKRKVFLKERDYEYYYHCLVELKHEENIKVYHYCFMPNHPHLLVGVEEKSSLSHFMQRVNGKYAYYYKKRRQYIGHLWQDRFKSKIIDNEGYLAQCGKYIELNPVRAGLVDLPQDYDFSSYRHYAFGEEDELVDDNPLFLSLDRDPNKRSRIYRDIIHAEMRL
jgi:putative transposase